MVHKSIETPPLNYSHKYEWQKDHKPNMTGTKDAHFPPSNPLSKNYTIRSKKMKWIMNLGLLKFFLIFLFFLINYFLSLCRRVCKF